MLAHVRARFWKLLHTCSPHAHDFVLRRKRAVKYLISGGTASLVNLSVLYALTDIGGMWYVFSAALAFLVAFVVSFCFQKFWTFEDRSTRNVQAQVTLYFLVALANLCLDTLLIYAFVEYGGFHYIVGQIAAGLLIAVESFFIYRRFIFKQDTKIMRTDAKRYEN